MGTQNTSIDGEGNITFTDFLTKNKTSFAIPAEIGNTSADSFDETLSSFDATTITFDAA